MKIHKIRLFLSVLLIFSLSNMKGGVASATSLKSEKSMGSYQSIFLDRNLAKAVYLILHPEKSQYMEEIDWDEQVTEKELSSITMLSDTRDTPISDLTGIEYLVNLKSLSLEGNEGGRITDVSPLKSLKQLESVALREEFISDVSVLDQLPKLRTLNVSGNQIKDAETLSGFTQVTSLNVSGNQLVDLRPLKDLPVVQKKDRSFQAFAQTVVKNEKVRTGEDTKFAVYLPDGTKLQPEMIRGYGKIQNEKSNVQWLEHGQSTLRFKGLEDEKGNPQFVAFLEQTVEGENMESRPVVKKTEEAGYPIVIEDIVGNVINNEDCVLYLSNSENDNYNTIQDAIDFVSSLENQSGGRIMIPKGKGTWEVDNKIILPQGVTLKGETEDTTLIRIYENFRDYPIDERDSVKYFDSMIEMDSHTAIKNITLDGQKGDLTASQYQNGITAKGQYSKGENPKPPADSDYLQNVWIEDVTIKNMTGSGITLDLVNDVTIQGSKSVTDEKAAMKVVNMGYDGIIGYSANQTTVKNTLTKTIGHVKNNGLPYHNYNICLSMRKMQAKNQGLTYQPRYPQSEIGEFTKNVVLDNPYWEGLDGHSVQGLTIADNVVVGVDRSIVVGGQNYGSAYYYESQDVSITGNRMNQSDDVKTWSPSQTVTPTQVGVAVWGATEHTPTFDEHGNVVTPSKKISGYTKGKVENNIIERVKPREKGTKVYGGIALKLTEDVSVVGNRIGTEEEKSVQLAAISLVNENKGFDVQNNSVGYIGYDGDLASIEQKSFAPIAVRGKYNNGKIHENNWKATNEIVVQDDLYGAYSDNRFEQLTTNVWQTRNSDERVPALYNYGIFGVEWDAKTGTITGKVGKDVGSVEVQQGTLEEVEASNHLVAGTKVTPQDNRFTIQAEDLKEGKTTDFVVVARNKHGNPQYQYKVNLVTLQNPDWYKVITEAYDVQQSSSLQGTVSSDHVKKIQVRVDGEVKVTVPVSDLQFSVDIREWVEDAVHQEVWVDTLDEQEIIKFSEKVALDDVVGFAITANPYTIPDPKVTGTVGPLVRTVQMAVNQKVVNNLAIAEGKPTFGANMSQFISSARDQVTATSLDENKIPRQVASVSVIDNRYTLTAQPYDLNHVSLRGTTGPEVKKVQILVDDKKVNEVSVVNQAFVATMKGRVPSVFSKVEVLALDGKGEEQNRVEVPITDVSYDVTADPYVLGRPYLTGTKGESVAFVDIYVNGNLMNHLTVPEGQTYSGYISGAITSKDDEVEVRGIAEDGTTVRSKKVVEIVIP